MVESVAIPFPSDLIAEVDRIVGPDNRTAHLVELARRDVVIQRQREAIHAAAGSWKDEDHPELANGSYEWVRKIRDEDWQRGRSE
jgi:hypothetical protein